MGYTLCALVAHYHTISTVKDPNETNRSKVFQIIFFFGGAIAKHRSWPPHS